LTRLYEGFVSEATVLAENANIKVGQLLGGGHQVYITEKIPASWLGLEGVITEFPFRTSALVVGSLRPEDKAKGTSSSLGFGVIPVSLSV
jgi:hypothetical protein